MQFNIQYTDNLLSIHVLCIYNNINEAIPWCLVLHSKQYQCTDFDPVFSIVFNALPLPNVNSLLVLDNISDIYA